MNFFQKIGVRKSKLPTKNNMKNKKPLEENRNQLNPNTTQKTNQELEMLEIDGEFDGKPYIPRDEKLKFSEEMLKQIINTHTFAEFLLYLNAAGGYYTRGGEFISITDFWNNVGVYIKKYWEHLTRLDEKELDRILSQRGVTSKYGIRAQLVKIIKNNKYK